MTELLVPRRFCGPPSSGNGGWSAGALAGTVAAGVRRGPWPTTRVSLRMPPPLDTPMPVTPDDGGSVATYDGAIVGTATPVGDELHPVPAVAAEVAREAMATYPGLTSHPFPTCFSCGTEREEGDGMRIFPGQVDDADGATRVASVWTPHPSVAEGAESRSSDPHEWHARVDDPAHASLTVTWSALDCIGGWAGDLTERLMVLASMTARVDALPVVGDEHVLVGGHRGTDGRKTFTAATLYTAEGRLLATAEHLWIAIDPASFGSRS